MRKNAIVALLALLAAACASTSTTGQSGLFRIEVDRLARDDGRAALRVVVENDATESLEVLDFGVRPESGESTFEAVSTTGPFQLAPGQAATSSFVLPAGAALPARVSVDVTWRRADGTMERRSFRADLP